MDTKFKELCFWVHPISNGRFIVLQFNYQNMKNKPFNPRDSFIKSLKNISQDCQSLFFSHTPRQKKSMSLGLDQSKKQISITPSNKLFQSSTPRSLTSRASTPRSLKLQPKRSQIRPFTVLTRRSHSSLSQNANSQICKQLYRKKVEQSKVKQNQKHQSLFVQKLMNSIKGSTVNLSGYEIGSNCMKELCNFLELHNISELILDKNPIGDAGIKQLEKIIENMDLQKLSVGSICMHEAGCDSLLQVLSRNKNLQSLNLCSYEGSYRNRLHHGGIKNIEKVIKNGLKKLNLSNTGIDDQNFKYLCQVMKKGCTLQVLNVSQNEITENGMQIFKRCVVRLELHELDLSKNKIMGGGFFQMAYLIGTQYNLTKISKSLKVLKLCYARNRKNAFTHFCKQLQRNQILESFYMDYFVSQNDDWIDDLSLFLRRNWNLKKLSMKKCMQLSHDCRGLMRAIAQHRGIEVLSIPQNYFDISNFKQMIECLTENKSIKVLDLRSCKISDNDLIKSVDSFTKIRIKKLYLDFNLINNAGADIIQKMIYRNKEIEELTLRGNCLTEKRIEDIKKLVSYNVEANRTIEPELAHYQLMEEKNILHKEQLKKTVNQLKEKEKSLKYKHLLHFIAKRQADNFLKVKEMKVHHEQIGKLSQMAQHLHKINDYRKKVIREQKNEEDNNASAVSIKLQQKPSYLSVQDSSQVTSSIQMGGK